MTDKVVFSVLIANFNNGRFIEEAIASIYEQSYSNWEIVVVDDASTDNSLEILEKYKSDTRIRIFINKENSGCGFTKRRCAELANGQICGFLDPDDQLCPNAIEIMVSNHNSHPECSLISSKYIYCNHLLKYIYVSAAQRAIPENTDYLHFNGGAVHHFATFKKRFYDKTNGIDPVFKRAVDQDLYYRLEEVGKLHFVDEALYKYRIHNGGISVFKNRNKAKFWHINAIINACRRRNISADAESIVAELLNRDDELLTLSKEHKLGTFLLKPLRRLASWRANYLSLKKLKSNIKQ